MKTTIKCEDAYLNEMRKESLLSAFNHTHIQFNQIKLLKQSFEGQEIEASHLSELLDINEHGC